MSPPTSHRFSHPLRTGVVFLYLGWGVWESVLFSGDFAYLKLIFLLRVMEEGKIKESLKMHENLPEYVKRLSKKKKYDVDHKDYTGMSHDDLMVEIEKGTKKAMKIVEATSERIKDYVKEHGPEIIDEIKEYGIQVIEAAEILLPEIF